MRIINRAIGIYISKSRNRKMACWLRWKLQKEKAKFNQALMGKCSFKKKQYIPNSKHDNSSSSQPRDMKVGKSINEYSRNANLSLKRSNSVVENMDYNIKKRAKMNKITRNDKNANNDFNSLSISISQVQSFSITKRNKNAFRLNSCNISHSPSSQSKYKYNLKDRSITYNNRSKSQLNHKETNINKTNKHQSLLIAKPYKPNTTSTKLTKEERNKFFNSLYESSSRSKANIFKLEMEKETKINQACTFKPVLYKSKINTKKHSIPFLTRLRNYEQIKTKNFNNLKEEIERQIPKPQSQQKQTSLTSRSKEDISTEIKEYSKRKKEKLRQMELDLYKEKGITFKPTLNDEKNKCIRDTITIRNRNFLEMRDEKLLYLSNRDLDECTFVPFINTFPIERKNSNEESYDVCIRLYDYQNRYEANREYIKKYYEVNYPFKPTISKNTEQILLNRHCNQNKNHISLKRKHEHEHDLKVICERQTLEQQQYEDELFAFSTGKINKSNMKLKMNSKDMGGGGGMGEGDKGSDSFKMSMGSTSDKRAYDLAKMYISVDDSLENFQKQIKKSKQYNRILEENRLRKDKKDYMNNNKKKGTYNLKNNNQKHLMKKHLDYYHNLY